MILQQIINAPPDLYAWYVIYDAQKFYNLRTRQIVAFGLYRPDAVDPADAVDVVRYLGFSETNQPQLVPIESNKTDKEILVGVGSLKVPPKIDQAFVDFERISAQERELAGRLEYVALNGSSEMPEPEIALESGWFKKDGNGFVKGSNYGDHAYLRMALAKRYDQKKAALLTPKV